jgi:predicted nucleic acid-binding Zn ribbon protein
VRRRAPRPLATAVESLARSVAPATPLARIQTVWTDAVGEFVAEHAEPLRERGGVLTVYCRESVWAQEVALMAPEYVAAINRRMGDDLVREIRTTATPR